MIGEGDGDGIVCNRSLIDLARQFDFHKRACRPYRAKTKGKVERSFRYIREDFFLARTFRNLDDLNAHLRHWLDTVANPRLPASMNSFDQTVIQALGNAFLPAQLGDTVLATQAVQHDPDLVFRGKVPPGRPTSVLCHLLGRLFGA